MISTNFFMTISLAIMAATAANAADLGDEVRMTDTLLDRNADAELSLVSRSLSLWKKWKEKTRDIADKAFGSAINDDASDPMSHRVLAWTNWFSDHDDEAADSNADSPGAGRRRRLGSWESYWCKSRWETERSTWDPIKTSDKLSYLTREDAYNAAVFGCCLYDTGFQIKKYQTIFGTTDFYYRCIEDECFVGDDDDGFRRE